MPKQLSASFSPLQIDPAYSSTLSVYDPTKASPPFTLISNSSSICKTFCALASCSGPPVMANACEYYYAYVDGSYLRGRAYSTAMSFPSTASPSSSSNSDPTFYVGEHWMEGGHIKPGISEPSYGCRLLIQHINESLHVWKYKFPFWHGL